MNKHLYLFVLLLTSLSCVNNNSNSLKSLIGGNGQKFWQSFEVYPTKAKSSFVFYADGTFEKIKKDKQSGKRYKYPEHHDLFFVDKKWAVINDSVMMFGKDVYYKILHISKDQIFLKSLSPKLNDTLKLYEDRDQTTPVDSLETEVHKLKEIPINRESDEVDL